MEALLSELSLPSEYAAALSGLTVEDLALLEAADLPTSIKPFHIKKLLALARAKVAAPYVTAPHKTQVVSDSVYLPPRTVACRSCGSPNLVHFRFCQLCGKATEQESPPAKTEEVEKDELAKLRAERLALEEELQRATATAAAVVAAVPPVVKQPSKPAATAGWSSVKKKEKPNRKPGLEPVEFAPKKPHTRTTEEDDTLRRHCYFGDRPKEFAALMEKEGFDCEGVFETYYHATPLSLAAGRGQISVIKALLAKNVPVNTKDDMESSPLCWAVSFGHIEAVELLLSHGADVRMRDMEGMTPLHFACFKKSGKDEIVRMLLRAGAEVNVEEYVSGRHPLDVAFQFRQTSIAEILKKAGGVCSSNTRSHDPKIRKQARKLISAKYQDIVGTKVEKEKAQAEKVVPRTKEEDDVYREHCWYNNRGAEFAAFLARPDFDLHSPFEQYHHAPPIVVAASRGHQKIVLTLLCRGADVNALNDDRANAFGWALSRGEFELCRLLLRNGADKEMPDVFGLSPIHYATMRKDRDISKLEFLLENGADANALSRSGETPMDLARRLNHKPAIELIRKYGGRAKKTV